ncbi:MAG TPA: GNAT family N-acetyltransferase [Candidatus Acidoferrales bacterium]|nr:GNAT family N-acetyltransferase [Candidatus Acidoferrales bacterium]
MRFQRFNGLQEVPWNADANAAWMNPLIERATVADLESLLPLVTAYREFYEQRADLAAERTLIAGHLNTGTSTIFIARIDEKAVGFVQLFQTYSTVWLGPSLLLEDLFVDPSARGAGIATKLLARALAYSHEIGAVGMFLETAMDNVAAQRVYERAGWSREGRFYKYNAPA